MGNKNSGLTLVEILITIALIIIVAAIAVPYLIFMTQHTQNDADKVTSDSQQRFQDQFGRAGYFIVDGTGENDGYLVAIWDENNDGVRQATETQVVGKIKK